jgi:uncharacterized protein YjbI with pentapeptide repeats
MAYVDLTGASLRKATVSGDESLWGANLTDADLSGALITGTNALTDAIFSNTVCPDRTNSDDSGGTCVGHGLAGSSAP